MSSGAAGAHASGVERNAKGTLSVEWLGRVPYAEALAYQLEAVEQRISRQGRDRLLLLEHPPVITFGRASREANLLVSETELAARGIALHRRWIDHDRNRGKPTTEYCENVVKRSTGRRSNDANALR